MLTTINLPKRSEWFNETLIQDVCSIAEKSRRAIEPGNHIKRLFASNHPQNRIEKVIESKIKANRILAKEIIAILLEDISDSGIDVGKIGVDYAAPTIHFWFEINDSDFDAAEKIKALFQHMNTEYCKSEFVLKYFLTQQSLDLGLPSDFLAIK